VTRIVRGRDIAPSTATQIAIQRALTLPTPTYRHHLLLLEPRDLGGGGGAKLAKLHGSIPFSRLALRYRPDELCGLLAAGGSLIDAPRACVPRELVAEFDWARVASGDRVARLDATAGLVIEAALP
jgi:glutamyl/glutaminyl-tRNA synthetase